MTLVTLTLGMMDNNCYILADDKGSALVIDPAMHGEKITETFKARGWRLCAIALTHCHFDHIGALRELTEAYPVPVYLGQKELGIADAMSHGRMIDTTEEYPPLLRVGDLEISVLRTPGHSPDSVCLQVGDCLFTGDTLFAGSCGRTDFAGGDGEAMAESLKMLSELAFEGRVLPGHGEETTLAREREFNPFLAGYRL